MDNATVWEVMFRFPTIAADTGADSTSNINWTDYHNIKIWDDSNHQWFWAIPGRHFNYDKWHIWTIAHTANGNGVTGKIYIDGNLIGTYNNTTHQMKIRPGSIIIGGGISTGGFYINDFRLYNHCLSPMEVKEISKGLILHYPLNRNGWGGENILINTHFDSQTTKTSGWDTTKNGTQMASSWGGFNGGVPNPSTVYHAHLKQINNEWVYEYIRTADESWLGISQGGLQSKLIAGKTYTFSWEEYRVEGNNYPTGGLYYFKTGATSANFHLGQFGGSNGNVLGKWRKFSYTFVAPTDGDYSKNMSWYIYGQSGGNGKMYMRHPKLEEGSVATPWCPNSTDVLATTIELNGNVEYDVSGYCNNGTRTGTFGWTSDTPKYQVSTKIAAASTGIKVPNFYVGDVWSMSVWFKYPSQDSSGWKALVILNNNGGDADLQFGNYINCNSNNIQYSANGKYTTGVTFTYGEWHHIVNTYDGTTLKCYLDGIYKTSLTPGQTLSRSNLGIGFKSTAVDFSSVSNSVTNAQLSDVRVYTTALSANDIKSLYQNSAYIDNQGNIYGAVYEEV